MAETTKMAAQPIERWVLRLAAEMLSDYSDRLSNDGCNDYDAPSWVPKNELRRLIRELESDYDETDGLEGYNWAVADAIAERIRKASEQ